MQHEIEKPSPCNDPGAGEAWQANAAGPRRKNATKPTQTTKTARRRSSAQAPEPTIAHYEANPNPPTTQCQAKLQIILATVTKTDN
jgi:hypothetical protein